MSKNRKYICKTPDNKCTGHLVTTSDGLGKRVKAHNTTEEAFNCHKNYLLEQGYERVGSREFKSPDGGPILVLDKKSKYGGQLRKGKEGRFMPPREGGGIIF